jgi:hypothetical protein
MMPLHPQDAFCVPDDWPSPYQHREISEGRRSLCCKQMAAIFRDMEGIMTVGWLALFDEMKEQ